MFTYIFERVGLVADGARLAVDALPKRGREDPARELVRVAETGRVNCMRHMKISAMSRADRKSQGNGVVGREAIEGLRFLASLPLAGAGHEKTQPFNSLF